MVISTGLLQELRHKSKVSHHYLESLNAVYSTSVVSKEERQAAIGIEATNKISETVHGVSTQNMQQFGTSDLIVVRLVDSKIATVIGIEIMLL